jgi:excisionase family DNA binding protein
MQENVIVTTPNQLAELIGEAVNQALQKTKFTDQSKAEPRIEADYLNVAEAAAYVRMAKQSIYQLVSRREIPFIKNGARVIFSKADLIEWVNNNKKNINKSSKINMKQINSKNKLHYIESELNFDEESGRYYTPIDKVGLVRMGELAFPDEQNRDWYLASNRSMKDLALELSTSRPKLFSFLRDLNIIIDREVNAKYISLGYFEERSYSIDKPNFNKTVNLISVTPKGAKVIKELIKILNPAVIMRINRKDQILQDTNNGLDIFKYFISDFKDVKKSFCSPLRADKKPSTNIFLGNDGVYLYKDFANGNAMNAFDFVQELRSINDFSEVMNIIQKEVLKVKVSAATVKPLQIEVADNATSTYWREYIMDEFRANQYLEKYEVFTIKSFRTNKDKLIHSTNLNPIFSFKISAEYYKIYQPLLTEFKHQWIGEKLISFNNILGIKQLPETCDTILITEGYKDCLVANANLNHHNIYAVGLDNIRTVIDKSTIEMLRGKCKNLLLCMDIDTVGLEGAKNKSEQHGLRTLTLPSDSQHGGGKDISDWFKLKLDETLLLDAIESCTQQPEPIVIEHTAISTTLQKLLTIESELTDRALKEIVEAPSVVKFNGFPIFKQGTLNVIQGKFGSHKSRLAQSFCSLLLSTAPHYNFAGFKKELDDVTVCYIDTERNSKEEFPAAIKSIAKAANIDLTTQKCFRYTSIKSIERNKRLDAVKQFLESICKNETKPVFAILDVATDCVTNFNDVEESMLLIDFVGNLCEEFNAIFLLVVHENFNNKKARGHIGSEGVNKSSTVISISVVNDNLIQLEYIKQRATKHFQP